MSETKLLPCPFCGEKPHFSDYSTENNGTWWLLECGNPGCDMQVRTAAGAEIQSSTMIEKWNTRALTPRQQAADLMYEALRFVQEHCQLYGAADTAREKIDAALGRRTGGK